MKILSTEQNIERPRIESYLDVRKYLADVYQWRKTIDPSFSYAQWAAEIGFKSRSFLRLVVTRKRSVTANSIPLFTKGLRLSAIDARYFERLVHYCLAETHQQKEHFFKELSQGAGAKFERTEIKDYYNLVSSTLGPRLQVLLTFADIERTPENLARLLNSTVAEVSKYLDILDRLGLASKLESAEGAEWRPKHQHFEIPESLGSTALQSYHRKSLEEAIEAIEIAPSLRRFQSALVALTPDEFDEFRGDVVKFLEASLAKFGKDEATGRRLYQINLNYIPVSSPILRPEKLSGAPVGETNQRLESDAKVDSLSHDN
jgi:uncharacterized protein (TIGR02147 family)